MKRDPIMEGATWRIVRRGRRWEAWSGTLRATLAIALMVIVLSAMCHQAYLRSVVRPVASTDLVVGGRLYHMVGWGKYRHLQEAKIVRVEGERVVTEEWGWFGTKTLYNSRRDLLDAHKVHTLSLDREWSAR